MTSKKCPECGLVNFADAEACRRCGVPLETESFEFVPAPKNPTFGLPRLAIIAIVVAALLAWIGIPRIMESWRSENAEKPQVQAAPTPLKSLVGVYSCVTKGPDFSFTETIEITTGSYAVYTLDAETPDSPFRIKVGTFEPGRLIQKSGKLKIGASLAWADLTVGVGDLKGMELSGATRLGAVMVENPDVMLDLTRGYGEDRARTRNPTPITEKTPQAPFRLTGLLLHAVSRDYTFRSPLEIQIQPDGSLRLPNKHVLKP